LGDAACVRATCADAHAGSLREGVLAEGTTVGRTSTRSAYCGGAQAPDVSFSWIAPATGTYAFNTLGSSFDTVLYAWSNACNDTALACDDNDAGLLQSEIWLHVQQGDHLVLVVDGNGVASGRYVLNVRPVADD
jgi:hypothetical protein